MQISCRTEIATSGNSTYLRLCHLWTGTDNIMANMIGHGDIQTDNLMCFVCNYSSINTKWHKSDLSIIYYECLYNFK